MKPLRWTEWVELTGRIILVGLFVWFGFLVRDLARLRQDDASRVAWAWAESHTRQQEQIRLLRAICLTTVTVYDANRGVCDPTGSAEIKKKPIPMLRGGPYK